MFDLWDIYQEIRIHDLSQRIGWAEGAPKTDAVARDEVTRVEESSIGLR